MRHRYKQIREHFGYSYSELAERTGCSPDLIMCVEIGRGYISFSKRTAFCELLGISQIWLDHGVGPMFIPGREVPPADLEGSRARVKQIREERGMSQEEFAAAIGYSAWHVGVVESGVGDEDSLPSRTFLSCVAEKFSVDETWLVTGKKGR